MLEQHKPANLPEAVDPRPTFWYEVSNINDVGANGNGQSGCGQNGAASGWNGSGMNGHQWGGGLKAN